MSSMKAAVRFSSRVLGATLALLLMTSGVLLAQSGSTASETPKPSVVTEVSTDTGAKASPQKSQTLPGQGRKRAARVWWNHPKIQDLDLSDDQKKLLAERSQSYQASRAQIQKRLADLHNRIGLAVRAGNLDAARKMSEKLAEFPNPVVDDGLFRLDVLAMLTADQLTYLADNFPVLLSEQWRGGGWALVRAGKHPRRGPHGHDN